ncbi:MAG: serine/threonine-protein kinase [Sandaracinaceae bacterium]
MTEVSLATDLSDMPGRIGTLPRVGEHVDRYEVVADIAHGGMAAVYAVRRKSIGGFDKVMAMKVLLPHLQSDRKFVDMFLDEARIASQMQHPNIVHSFDLGEHEGQPFMVMEMLRGQTLSRVLKKARREGRKLPLGFLCRVLSDAAEGLHSAHVAQDANGEPMQIVHRDMSPQNVHVGYDGTVKVVDFGIARARGRITGTQTGELKGKISYMAPEQISTGKELDHRADLWALGVVAWELLASRRLFRAEEDARRLWLILNEEIPPLRDVVPTVPDDVAALVMACLQRDPEQRPADARSLSDAFDAVARRLEFRGGPQTAEVMLDLFSADMAVEEERLRTALRGTPSQLIDEEEEGVSGVGSSPSVSSALIGMQAPVEASTAPKRTWKSPQGIVGIVLVLLLLGVGAGAALSSVLTGSEPTTVAEPSAPAPVLHVVTVTVPEEARLALVNGERRLERPLQITLAEGERAEVEIVAPDGELFEHTVRADDDGRALSFPVPVVEAEEPVAAPPEPVEVAPPTRPRRRRGAPASGRRGSLLRNPYE